MVGKVQIYTTSNLAQNRMGIWLATPRILMVDMPKMYKQAPVAAMNLPRDVHHCLKSNFAGAMLDVGRLDAAIYTASLKHISQGFYQKTGEALNLLDTKCGATTYIQAEQKRQKLADKQKELKDTMNMACGFANTLFGTKLC